MASAQHHDSDARHGKLHWPGQSRAGEPGMRAELEGREEGREGGQASESLREGWIDGSWKDGLGRRESE